MTRGINRQAIHIKDIGSPYFEEAIFIVSKNADLSGMTSSDMAEEARKIVNSYIKRYAGRPSTKHRWLLAIAVILILSAVACFIVATSLL
ncbi:MAG: hypothetical protein Q8865_07390 [Bacillota bacterium]|nr:hypothetical protein [Bacillota bacterium]